MPTAEGKRGGEKEMEGEGGDGRRAGVAAWREGVRGRAKMRVSISTLLSPPSRQPPSVFCSISKAAGALSSTTDKLGGKAEAFPFLFFSFLFFL